MYDALIVRGCRTGTQVSGHSPHPYREIRDQLL